MTEYEKNLLATLNEKFQALRNQIIAREGEISIYKTYPELDEISGQMFKILSGGSDHITITSEQVHAWGKA